MTARAAAGRRRGEAGQSLIEFAVVLPFLVLVAFGVIEVSYALLDQHVVTSFSREGSNLISRNTSLRDAVTAMRQMTSRPLNLDDGSSKIILSVVRRVATPSAANYDRDILYQRTEYGTLAAQSRMTGGGGAFGPAPDYQALDPGQRRGAPHRQSARDAAARRHAVHHRSVHQAHDADADRQLRPAACPTACIRLPTSRKRVHGHDATAHRQRDVDSS